MNTRPFSDTDIEARVATLRGAYAKSGAAVLRKVAVYAVSNEAFGELETSPLFTRAQVEAETDFSAFCGSLRCIGIRGARPVMFP